MEEDKNLKRDGKYSVSDVYEASPEFTEEYLKMSSEFFKKENPEFHKLMKRVQKENGTE